MKLLVTGAAGLLGTELCLQARATGHEVVGVDNCSRYTLLGEDGPRPQQQNLDVLKAAGIEVLRQDFRDLDTLAGIDAIVHSAAQVCHSRKADDPLGDLFTNVIGTVELLENARSSETPFLFISSSKVYGENFDHDFVNLDEGEGVCELCPLGDQTHITFFGASKVAADLFCQQYGRQYEFPVGVFRPGCFTGRWALAAEAQNWLPWLVHCAKTGRPFTMFGDGQQTRDLLHVADLADACLRWCSEPTTDVWNIGGGADCALTLQEAIERVQALVGRKIDIQRAEPRPGDIGRLVIDSRKFEDDYGWTPQKSLDDTFAEAVLP